MIKSILKPIIDNKIVKKLIIKITSYVNKINESEKRDYNKSLVTSSGYCFFPEANVINMQNDASKITLGEGTYIRGELQVYAYGGKIIMGDNCFLGAGSKIWSGDSITIGNNVLIGHNVNIVDFSHKTYSVERAEAYKKLFTHGHSRVKENIPSRPIVIEDDVIIYAGSSIVMGVTIGKACIISAGSVVIKDIPPYSQVLGNPAKVVWRTK